MSEEAPLWHNRNYWLLLVGTAVSGLGDQIYAFVLPWLIYTLTGSALAMTGMRTAEFLPNIVLGLVAGVYVDRWDRRRTLMWAAIGQAVLLTVMAALAGGQTLGLWGLYTLGFLLSCAGFVGGVGFTSFVPVIVPKSQLAAANAQSSATSTVVRLLGPAIAGVVVATVGPLFGLTSDAFSFLAITVAVWAIRAALPRRTPNRAGSVLADNADAITFLRRCRPLAAATLAVAGLNLFHASVLTLVLYRARHDLAAAPVTAGLIFSAGAVGALLGTAAVTRLNRHLGWQAAFLAAFPVLIVGSAVMMAAGSTTILAIGYGIDAVGVTVANVNYFTGRQTLTPSHLLGRVASITSMVMKIPFPISLIGLGLIADRASAQFAFAVIALGLLGVAAVAARPVLAAKAADAVEAARAAIN